MKSLRKNRSTLGFKGGAMAFALVAFGLTACQTPDDTAGTTDPGQPTTEQPAQTPQAEDPGSEPVRAGDLSDNLEDYLGQTVSVRAEVAEEISENVFVIRGDGLFGGNDVVVFNASDSPLMLPDENGTDRVQVTGQVQEVTAQNLSQQYGITLDEDTLSDYEGNPAIIAESIILAPQPGEISDNPEAFYDQPIAVEGNVGEQYDPNTFTIARAQFLGGSDVLVVSDSPDMANIQDSDDVIILGVLRAFNAEELEREYNVTWDENLRQTLQSDYGEESVFIAQQVFPVNR